MKIKYLTYMLPACLMVSAASAMKYELDATEIPNEKNYSVHIVYSEQTGTKQTVSGLTPVTKSYEERVHLRPNSMITGDFFMSAPEKSFEKVDLWIYNEACSNLMAYSVRTMNVRNGKVSAKIILRDNLPYLENK